ncbi:GIY-YIG nuclease family protein [Halomonas sp. A40-4]|nr:GIY-YIG nuclease family protein [Halomonas sp. A40-4]
MTQSVNSVTAPGRDRWYLYLLECQRGTYVGITNNLAKRYRAHASGKGARFTRANPPVALLGAQPFPDRASASRAEYQLKRQSAQQKRAWASAWASPAPLPMAGDTMHIFYSDKTRLRQARTELHDGVLVAPFECPERVDLVLKQLQQAAVGELFEPRAFGLEPVLAVHDADYVNFLADCWHEWVAAGHEGEAIPNIWPARTLRDDRIPRVVSAKLGYYALAAETSISEGTFEAAMASKDVALGAVEQTLATGEPSFGLCRPPGHHAAFDQFGGYCFFNNAAIAAQRALASGKRRVAILDVDFHHGNGTQQIFYERDDVLFISLHGDPEVTFPYYSGYADETGRGRGEGFNTNYPLPPGTTVDTWMATLDNALARIKEAQCDMLIVSLGVDIFEGDPISAFTFTSGDFSLLGQRLTQAGLPTVLLMEGGYAVDDIGINVVNVLQGFKQGIS